MDRNIQTISDFSVSDVVKRASGPPSVDSKYASVCLFLLPGELSLIYWQTFFSFFTYFDFTNHAAVMTEAFPSTMLHDCVTCEI